MLSVLICFSMTSTTKAAKAVLNSNDKITQEQIAILEQKYNVQIDLNSQIKNDKVQFKNVTELENFLKTIKNSSPISAVNASSNLYTTSVINAAEDPSSEDPSSSGYKYYHYSYAAPDAGYMQSAINYRKNVDFYYSTSYGSLSNIKNIKAYGTGLSTSTWEQLSSYYSKTAWNTVVITTPGVWHLNFGIGSGGGIVSWRDTWNFTVTLPLGGAGGGGGGGGANSIYIAPLIM